MTCFQMLEGVLYLDLDSAASELFGFDNILCFLGTPGTENSPTLERSIRNPSRNVRGADGLSGGRGGKVCLRGLYTPSHLMSLKISFQ